MEVINKLYSTVSTTVSQLSGVLPGNPVTREYEITSYTGTAGTSLQWKVYKGFKKSTKQDGSIFVFEKRSLDRCSKNDQEQILDILRKGVAQLTRLRHPQILTVQHPLEESRESLAFAAEPVLASLANLLSQKNNLSADNAANENGQTLYEVEIKHGLVQIGEGLVFLHNNVKMLHGNINPQTILVNHQGAWKIFGFDFCVLNTSNPETEPFWPCTEFSHNQHPYTIPNLDFLAPEYAISLSCSPASDMFSVGQLIVAIYNNGQPLFCNKDDWHQFKKNYIELKRLSDTKISFIPDALRVYVKMMLNVTPELRPDAHQFVKVNFFEDVGVKTLTYLDSLFQWDNLQKSQFYKGLPQIVPTLPHRVSINRILPCLMKEFVNPTMVPFVLPNVLLITEQCSKDEYITHILPHLKPVMKIQDPIQVLLIFMQKMELLLRLTPPEEIKSDVLPMIYRALESNVQQIQELCLSVLPTFAGLIDYPAMKNALLPRIKRLCTWTQHVSVRVNCLVCIGKLLEHLDKWLVLDEVLPFLPSIPSRDPAVLMGVLGIYKLALTHKKLGITKEFMANKILPFLMPLSIESDLTLNQFNAFMSVIKEMVNRVEAEHRTKLEQLHQLQQSQRSSPIVMQERGYNIQQDGESDLDKVFSGLGIDSSTLISNVGTSNSNYKINFLNGSAKSLSLEEKQSIVHQQEVQHRLQGQPALSLSPVSQTLSTKDSTVSAHTVTIGKQQTTQEKHPAFSPPTIPMTTPLMGPDPALSTKNQNSPVYNVSLVSQQESQQTHPVLSPLTNPTTVVSARKDFSGLLEKNLSQMDVSMRKIPMNNQLATMRPTHQSSFGGPHSEAFSSFQSANVNQQQWSAPVTGFASPFNQIIQGQQPQWNTAVTQQTFYSPVQQFPQSTATAYSPETTLIHKSQKPARKLSISEIDDLLQ